MLKAAPERNNVLVELETLQNDLLVRLDDLDQQVSQVLKEWTTAGRDHTVSLSSDSLADIPMIEPGAG